MVWEVLYEFNEEDKNFPFFITDCDKSLINCLGSLVVIIARFGCNSQKLLYGHTCFNHILLLEYQNIEKQK